MSYDDCDDYPMVRSVDLERADNGFMLCPDCEGQGTYMFHKCYPNGPVECEEYCSTCDGEGQLPIPAKASVSRNKHEGLYVGVKDGKHTRAKMLGDISLMFVRKPAAPTALAVRNYREGVWK